MNLYIPLVVLTSLDVLRSPIHHLDRLVFSCGLVARLHVRDEHAAAKARDGGSNPYDPPDLFVERGRV